MQTPQQRKLRWAAIERIGPHRRTVDDERSLIFHRAEADAPDSGTRVNSWLRNCSALEAWVKRAGRMPSPLAHEHRERHLGHWVRRQRRDADALCSYQRERLEAIPGFEFEPRAGRWERALYELEDFVGAARRAPSHHAFDLSERRLGLWVRRQRQQAQALTPYQHELIARALKAFDRTP